jgi:hypothetical protein
VRLFENKVLRRIFKLKRGVVRSGWRKLHFEELHNLYSIPNIIRALKSKSMKLKGYLIQM